MFDKLIPWKKHEGDVPSQLTGRQQDYPIARLHEDFDRLWDHFWGDWKSGGMSLWDDSRWFGSHVNWDDNEKEYVLRAELPGFEPEDFEVKVSGDVLTLRAEHVDAGGPGGQEEGKKDGSYRRFGGFYESFTLPQGVLSDQIDARYHSGVLELHLPKSEASQAKRIAVKSA